MATAGLPLWSTTAASNATADPAVNFAEGMAPSAVNDSARALMASVAKWRDDFYGITTGLSTGGTSTAFTVTTNSTYATAAVMSGAIFTIIPHTTSGAAPTLAVDGLTARALNFSNGVAVPTGALTSGTPYFVRYVHASTQFIVIGASLSPLTATDIIGGTSLTTVATDDSLPIYDLSATANKKISVANLFAGFAFAGAQLPYGAIYNGTISESNGTNAVTFALKTLAGTDPSATDPVLLAFRNSTVGTGNYVYRTVTAALSLTISSGSTMGFTSATAGRLWIVLFDDAGTIRMGAINCLSGSNIYPLGQMPVASSTAEGGAGGADSAHVFYTGTAVTSKSYLILGYASYETGIATAGSWNASPTRIQLFGAGVPLPGSTIQTLRTTSGAVATGSTAIPTDDTIPQITEGDQYMSQAITPTSASNLIEVDSQAVLSIDATTTNMVAAIFRNGTNNAISASFHYMVAANVMMPLRVSGATQAATTSAVTISLRAGGASNTTTFNGSNGGRSNGGAMNSFIRVSELMA